MYYYQHNIGDFDKATRHLTRIERSIYRDLIELYYDTEMQLNADIRHLCRKVLANSSEEVTAVEQVLNEFFTLTPDGWYHDRCEEEIERYKSFNSQRSKAGKASAAARKEKRQRALSGRSTDEQREPNEAATNQKPETRNHKPENNLKDIDDSGESPAAKPPCKATEVFEHWKLVMNHPKAVLDEKRIKLIRKWLKAGYSPESLMDSIAGYTKSAHHMGHNDRNTKYDGLELILRDAGHIDAGLKHLELSKSKGENNHGVKIYHGNKHEQLEQWRQNKSAELAEAAERAEAEIALLSQNGN